MIATIACKELKSMFGSPLAWIVLAALQLIFAWIFFMRLDTFLELQPRLQTLANAPGATEIVISPLYAAAAVVLRVGADGTQRFEPMAPFDLARRRYAPIPIGVSREDEQVFLLSSSYLINRGSQP